MVENNPDQSKRFLNYPHSERHEYGTAEDYYILIVRCRGDEWATNFFGEDHVHFVSNDGEYNSEEGTVTIVVIGTNDPPTASESEFNSQDTYCFDSLISDPDGDELTLTSIPPTDNGSLETLLGGSLTQAGD